MPEMHRVHLPACPAAQSSTDCTAGQPRSVLHQKVWRPALQAAGARPAYRAPAPAPDPATALLDRLAAAAASASLPAVRTPREVAGVAAVAPDTAVAIIEITAPAHAPAPAPARAPILAPARAPATAPATAQPAAAAPGLAQPTRLAGAAADAQRLQTAQAPAPAPALAPAAGKPLAALEACAAFDEATEGAAFMNCQMQVRCVSRRPHQRCRVWSAVWLYKGVATRMQAHPSLAEEGPLMSICCT